MEIDRELVRAYTERYIHLLPQIPGSKDLSQSVLQRLSELPEFILPATEPFADGQLADLHQHLLANREKVLRTRAKVFAASSRAGVEVMAIKGSTVEALYPPPLIRRCNDVDLLVRDEEALWRLSDVLRAEGFWLYGLFRTVSAWRGQPVVQGFASFAGADEEETEVEVSFGAFSGCGGAIGVPAFWLWEHAYTDPTVGHTCLRPDLIGMLCTLLMELYGREEIRARDILDFCLMIQQLEPAAHRRFADAVHELGFGSILSRLIAVMRRYMSPTWFEALPWVRPSIAPDTAWTLRRNLTYVLPYAFRHESKWRSLALLIANYIDEKWNEMAWRQWERVLRWRRFLETPHSRLVHNRSLVLVALDESLRGEPLWYQSGPYDFFRTPAGTFLATLNSMESEEELDRARRYLKAD